MLHRAPWQKRLDGLVEHHGHCQFGLPALIAPLIATGLSEVGLGAVAGSSILGVAVPEIAAGALVGAGGGAALSGLTGGNPLLGAVSGGLTGGLGTFGPTVGSALGIGTVGGDILTGVAGGVLGSEITGSSPLTGALTGGAMGAISGTLGGSSAPSTTTTTGSAVAPAGAGAGTTAVPAGAGAAPAGAAAQGDIGNLLAGPATTGTGVSGNLLAGPATTGGSPGTVSGPSSPGVGPVSGTPTASSGTTFGGNLPTWATPSAISTGWSETAAAGGSPLAPDASFGSKLLSGVEGDIGKLVSNPVGLLAGGLLLSQMFGGQNDAEKATMDQLQQQAASAASTATMLQAPLRSGVLPPGAQSALDLAQKNAQATARSTYAGMGMGGSTGEADYFQSIAENIAAQKVGIEDLLFSQAGPYAQLAANDYTTILNQQRAQDQQFSGALTNFVAALAGSTAGSRTAA